MGLFGGAPRTKADTGYVRGLEGMVAAIERSQAVIEFELDGTIVRANQNFLSTVGYSAEEVVVVSTRCSSNRPRPALRPTAISGPP